MRPAIVVTWAVALVAACGGPTSSGHLAVEAEPEATAEIDPVAAAEATVETDAAEEAQEAPSAAAPAAISVTALGAAPAVAGEPVKAGQVARLVGLRAGVRDRAIQIAAKVRRAYGVRLGRRRSRSAPSKASGAAPPGVALGAAPAMDAAERAPEPAPSAEGGESITNVQVAGVDEGGIVKPWGDYLIILRRGRLFTARLGDAPGEASAVAAIDVRPPRSSHETWYDEMLVHSDSGTIVVIGFSYDHDATELALFRVAADGTLSRRGTHLLRSSDYYSSRNYASRLVGDTLVFYMPHYLVDMASESYRVSLPATKRLGRGPWRSIVRDSQVFQISGDRDSATLHTVVTCDLAARSFRCQARGVLGGEGRTFFVSREAIYVWVMPTDNEWDYGYDDEDDEAELPDPSQMPSHLFRLPLDGSRPSALVVRGAPIDQFSFLEGEGDLWVVVQAQGSGDAMWSPEVTAGALALLRVPLSAFGRNVREMAPGAYRSLPSPYSGRGGGSLQNRFVGEYVLYGSGTTWVGRAPSPGQGERLFLHRYDSGETFAVDLAGGVDRIEAMASDAVVVGTDGQDLHFRALALDEAPRAAGHYVRRGAMQGETRSHGFFYRPTGAREGVLGLPTRGAGAGGAAQLRAGSAEVLYLAVDQLDFDELGALASGAETVADRCEVSCVDWYGNARPLFYRSRVFALLGYEIVEGRIAGGSITEAARMTLLSALAPEDQTPTE